MLSFKINLAVMSRARACNPPWRLSVAELELKNKSSIDQKVSQS